jgi:hypothetical protein
LHGLPSPSLAVALALFGAPAVADLREVSLTSGVHILLLVGVLLGILLSHGSGHARVAGHLGLPLAPLLIKGRPDVVQPGETGLDVAINFRWKIAAM